MNSDDDEIDYETVVDYRMKASDDKAMASHVLRAKSQAAKKMPMLKSLLVGFALWLRVFLVSLNIIEPSAVDVARGLITPEEDAKGKKWGKGDHTYAIGSEVLYTQLILCMDVEALGNVNLLSGIAPNDGKALFDRINEKACSGSKYQKMKEKKNMAKIAQRPGESTDEFKTRLQAQRDLLAERFDTHYTDDEIVDTFISGLLPKYRTIKAAYRHKEGEAFEGLATDVVHDCAELDEDDGTDDVAETGLVAELAPSVTTLMERLKSMFCKDPEATMDMIKSVLCNPEAKDKEKSAPSGEITAPTSGEKATEDKKSAVGEKAYFAFVANEDAFEDDENTEHSWADVAGGKNKK